MDSGQNPLIGALVDFVKQGTLTKESASPLIRKYGGDPDTLFSISTEPVEVPNGHSTGADIATTVAFEKATVVPETEYQFKDVAPLFPSELKKLNRWIVRTADKHPFSAYEEDDNLGPIDPHDEKYQAEYDTALGTLELTTNYSGLGFVFNYSDGLTGSDFDN